MIINYCENKSNKKMFGWVCCYRKRYFCYIYLFVWNSTIFFFLVYFWLGVVKYETAFYHVLRILLSLKLHTFLQHIHFAELVINCKYIHNFLYFVHQQWREGCSESTAWLNCWHCNSVLYPVLHDWANQDEYTYKHARGTQKKKWIERMNTKEITASQMGKGSRVENETHKIAKIY